MGQVPPKDFLPSAPIAASAATNVLNTAQKAPQNAQTPLLPQNFTDPGAIGATQPAASNPFALPAQNSVIPGNSPLFGGPVNPVGPLKGFFQ